MASVKPVYCEKCGSQVLKSGYCSNCYLHVDVLKKAKNTSNYYYNIGYDKATVRDLSGAIEALTMALNYDKDNIDARNLLGLVYYEMGENVLALVHWVLSVNYKTSGNIATRYLKEVKQDSGRLDEMDQVAKKFNKALYHAQARDFDLAHIQLRTVLSENPHFVNGYLLLALICMAEDNYERARKAIKRVLLIDKANPVAIHYLREMGDTDENIIKLRMDTESSHESDKDFIEELGIEDEDVDVLKHSKKRALKEYRVKKKKANIENSFEEVSFIKYSGVYVIVGIVLGILLMYFVFIPGVREENRSENEQVIKTYSAELATKNNDISKLNDQLEVLNDEIKSLNVQLEDAKKEKLPDYSQIQHGMSENDIANMLKNE